MQPTEPRYCPQVFDQPDLADAKAIILTPEAGLTTDERWERETAFLRPFLEALPAGLAIDYGCGIGRLSKVLNETRPVLGVDVSPVMRAQSLGYVDSQTFDVIPPQMLNLMGDAIQAHSAVASWVLQHVEHPHVVISTIANALRPGGKFLVLDRFQRLVPVIHGHVFMWADDGHDVARILNKYFEPEFRKNVPTDLCAEGAVLVGLRKR
jgi:SAM-dependent methyltransferase